MNSSAANVHSTRLPSEAEPGQRGPDMDSATQQLKLKERQRFFEEAFQHDVDVYLSSPHLTIRDHRRPPIGSISSMEVNVDLLDQMDMSDQEAFDVFLSSGEEGALNSPLPPVQGPSNNNAEVLNNGLFRRVLERFDGKPRMSSSSSDSSSYSQTATSNDNDRDTPVLPSDDEETRGGVAASTRAATPPETDKAKTLQSSQ